MIFKLLTTSYLSAEVLGQGIEFTSCPGGFLGLFGGNLDGVENFDRDKYLKGTWYEYKRASDSVDDTCVSYTTIPEPGMTADDYLINEAYISAGGAPTDLDHYLKWIPDTAEGHVSSWIPFFYVPTVVVDTDYDNYAILYGCENWLFGLFSMKTAHILTRKRQADKDILAKADKSWESKTADTGELVTNWFTID